MENTTDKIAIPFANLFINTPFFIDFEITP